MREERVGEGSQENRDQLKELQTEAATEAKKHQESDDRVKTFDGRFLLGFLLFFDFAHQ